MSTLHALVERLAAVDRTLPPGGGDVFARRLARAVDDRRIVFASPVLAVAHGPALACADADMRAALAGPCAQRDRLRRAARLHPGVRLLFTDRMNAHDPAPHLGGYVSATPCGAVGLAEGEACAFGHVDLDAFRVPRDRPVPVDLVRLAATVTVLVRALDDAVESFLRRPPDAASARVTRSRRKIAVGVRGLPDGSPRACRLAREVVAFVNYTSKRASLGLARSRGACPAVWDGRSRYADPAFLGRFADSGSRTVEAGRWTALAEEIAVTGMLRHSATTALPPTGPPLSPSTAAALRACVDEGVSVTVTLRTPATPGDVFAIWCDAWRRGCTNIAVRFGGC
ncbi:hypothetical protein [Actinomadura kijaniata]|uniref:hypothetical protein n=1 Tax=Actinomadura kijaniata TaxID=46161 RepID=UPI00082C5B1D|nr:hypothetical protein [Actinomadura kijaniata]